MSSPMGRRTSAGTAVLSDGPPTPTAAGTPVADERIARAHLVADLMYGPNEGFVAWVADLVGADHPEFAALTDPARWPDPPSQSARRLPRTVLNSRKLGDARVLADTVHDVLSAVDRTTKDPTAPRVEPATNVWLERADQALRVDGYESAAIVGGAVWLAALRGWWPRVAGMATLRSWLPVIAADAGYRMWTAGSDWPALPIVSTEKADADESGSDGLAV